MLICPSIYAATAFQGGALLRAATLVAGDALSHCNLPSDGPVGAAILAHPIYIADLAFRQGKMGAQGFRRSAGEQRALASAPAPMPQLLVLALTAADRVTEDQGFSEASAHDLFLPNRQLAYFLLFCDQCCLSGVDPSDIQQFACVQIGADIQISCHERAERNIGVIETVHFRFEAAPLAVIQNQDGIQLPPIYATGTFEHTADCFAFERAPCVQSFEISGLHDVWVSQYFE